MPKPALRRSARCAKRSISPAAPGKARQRDIKPTRRKRGLSPVCAEPAKQTSKSVQESQSQSSKTEHEIEAANIRVPNGSGAMHSAFFNQLNYDCRALIYSYLVPPFQPDASFVGLAMSCQQAHTELVQAGATLLKQHLESFMRKHAGHENERIGLLNGIDASRGFPGLQKMTFTVEHAIFSERTTGQPVPFMHMQPLLELHFKKLSFCIVKREAVCTDKAMLAEYDSDYDFVWASGTIDTQGKLLGDIMMALCDLGVKVLRWTVWGPCDNGACYGTECVAFVWYEQSNVQGNGVRDSRNGNVRFLRVRKLTEEDPHEEWEDNSDLWSPAVGRWAGKE